MLDTTSTEAARLRAQLAAQNEKHAAEVRGYREQADRDLSNLVTAQLEVDRLTAENADLRDELCLAQLELAQLRQRCDTQQAEIDNNARRNAWAAVDEDEAPAGFWTGPTPANRKFVSAVAAMEPDETEIAEAIEQAEREEQERFYQDSNETLGLSQGAV